ncbi:quinone-dependent dihydroorotate dehydrogenase [Sediminivirga luteola]|uniref:quinone-dependent dihydroorotate dehydrogenase n=1 Tax=Sediminivirga luteola TaxID=1774748 RepID=UPI001F567571|nr:quinone-dependent dihydroorotate dehydrogenase [Sediminivirga luteola]
MYKLLFRTVFAPMSAERAHHIGFGAIKAFDRVPVAREAVGRALRPRPEESAEVLGLRFPNRFGLAAGFDKNADGVRGLARLGFGFIEVGTITGRAQPGNPAPRMFRFTRDRALVNRMGFNNVGADAAAVRLADQRRLLERIPAPVRPVVGVNIGKTKDVAGLEATIADYRHSTGLLAPLADYLVLNVSSPNTPGLRDLQAVESLRPLIQAVQETAAQAVPHPRSALGHVPLLVKIAPDLADADVVAVTELALELGVDGVVASNTTISREGLRTDAGRVGAAGPGGLSGPPLAGRACDMVRLIRRTAGPGMTVIAAGGIETAADARARLAAGADLLQGYTGFIYHGPFWPRRIAAAAYPG